MKYFVQVKFREFQITLKAKNFKFLHCLIFQICILVLKFYKNFNLTPINFQKIANWPLKFFKNYNMTPQIFEIYKLTPNFNFQIWPQKLKFIKLPKNNDYEIFYYSIQTKVLRNESNLIELFKLPRILNCLKFSNYLIQTHSKGLK